jgi:phosphohistidine phosphatase
MELILWRHAHAAPGFFDLARELDARGRKEARDAAQWLNERLPTECRILVSPARRTQQTAAILARPYETVPALAPDASVVSFLAAIDWPKKEGVTLVIGHQPTLGEVATCLLGEPWWTPKTASLCWLKATEATEASKTTGTRQIQVTLIAVFTP